MTDLFNINRDRRCSEPVNVPNTPTSTLINTQQQPRVLSHSSGYGSAFGNGLSSTANSWTLG